MAKRRTTNAAQRDASQIAPEDLMGRVMVSLEKSLGDEIKGGVVIRRMTDEHFKPFAAVPFGIKRVDEYLHGGIPSGRITEVYGPEGSGKTTLCLHAMAAMHRAIESGQQGMVMYVDSEYGFDAPYAARLGVNVDLTIMVQPQWGQQAFQIIHQFCTDVELMRSGFDPSTRKGKDGAETYDALPGGPYKGNVAVLVDSVAALVPKSEWDAMQSGDFDSPQVAEAARMMSTNLRRLTGAFHRANVAALFTNQTRDTIQRGGMGPQKTTPGGNALKFYASSRWETGRRGFIKEGSAENERVVGQWGSLRVVKCRLFAPFAPELRLPYTDHGIDIARLVFEALLATGVIKKSSSWYQFECEGHPYQGIKFQGTTGYYDLLEKKSLDLDTLEALALGKIAPVPAADAPPPPPSEPEPTEGPTSDDPPPGA